MFIINDTGTQNTINIPKSVIDEGQGRLDVSANRCTISFDSGVKLRGLNLVVSGDEADIYIGKACILNGRVVIKAKGCTLTIGENTTWMNPFLSFHERGSIVMGEDCMLSGDIRMDVSDMHSIIDKKTGQRINLAEDITIGRHVWVGQGVFITKGCNIGDDVIIGAKSVVTKDIPAESLAVGVPAKVIRGGVTWDRRRL